MDAFTKQYARTALWSSLDDDVPLNSLNLPLSLDCAERMQADCDAFRNLLSQEGIDVSAYEENQIAHDFWLTRNGHGAGFWDGDYPSELGDLLTKWARSFGPTDLYICGEYVECAP